MAAIRPASKLVIRSCSEEEVIKNKKLTNESGINHIVLWRKFRGACGVAQLAGHT